MRFDYKVITIDEAKDISTMKLDELRTFEMELREKKVDQSESKNQSMSHVTSFIPNTQSELLET